MRQEVLEGNVVSAFRQGLAARIGKDRFGLWFGANVHIEQAEDAVVISAPDEFTVERLRRQFGREIHTTLATIATTGLRSEFRVQQTRRDSETAVDDNSVPERRSGSDSGQPKKVEAAVAAPLRAAAEGPIRRRLARFESYVVGASNRVAATAAQSVVERLGAISPLFLYGPTGSGKTHLLEAICTSARAATPATRTLLLSAEQFTTSFLEALQGSGLPSFRRKVRDVDLLLIDDVQFLAGKRATLVEFHHTLDALVRQGRQLVVTSDRVPAELSGLGPELVARLTGGLVCGLDWADFETRRNIARQWMVRDGLQLPDEVLDMMAAETTGDARQIRGALYRLLATSQALKRPVTTEMARNALSDIFAASKRVVRLPEIERAVCDTFGLEAKSLRESGKSRAASQPRMLAMWLARKYTRMPFSEISEFFGRRSHTTVILAEQKVNSWLKAGAQLRLGGNAWTADEAIRRLEAKLRTG